MPFYIATNMTSYSDKIGRANLFVPDAPTFADSCVRTLGRLESTTGYWSHELQVSRDVTAARAPGDVTGWVRR